MVDYMIFYMTTTIHGPDKLDRKKINMSDLYMRKRRLYSLTPKD